jgi:putative toxin-antitoxin system antitoxin component (TIGR02293 family)
MSSKSMGLMVSGSTKKKRVAFLESLEKPIEDTHLPASQDTNQYAIYLGYKVSRDGSFSIVDKVKTGIPMTAGKKLASHLGVTPSVLFIDYLKMSRSTVMRRKQHTSPRFNPDQSDKLVRYARLLSQATQLMEGDKVATQDWLNSPSAALGGQTPLDCTTTEVGARRVEDLITSLEYGMFS